MHKMADDFIKNKSKVFGLKRDGNTKQAIAECEKMLRTFPQFAGEINSIMGEVYCANNEFLKALPYLEQALVLKENSADLYETFGKVYRSSELGSQNEKAIQSFTRSLSLRRSPYVLCLRAETYSQDAYSQAEKDLREAMEIFANEEKERAEAKDAGASGAVKKPQTLPYACLAELYERQERIVPAIRVVKTGLLMNPTDPRLKKVEARLEASIAPKELVAYKSKEFFYNNVATNVDILFDAAELGQYQQVYQLFNRFDPLSRNREGELIIHVAARKGFVDLIVLALDHYNFIDERDHKLRTPVVAAIIHGKRDAMEELLLKGAKRDQLWNDKTLLEIAAESGHVDIVRNLMADEVLLRQSHGAANLLQVAIASSSIGVIHSLLSEDMSLVNKVNPKTNRSALNVCIDKNDPRILKILLDYQGDVLKKELKSGMTAMEYAADKKADKTLMNVLDTAKQAIENAKARGEKRLQEFVVKIDTYLKEGKVVLEEKDDPKPNSKVAESAETEVAKRYKDKARRTMIGKEIEKIIKREWAIWEKFCNLPEPKEGEDSPFVYLSDMVFKYLMEEGRKEVLVSKKVLGITYSYKFNAESLAVGLTDVFNEWKIIVEPKPAPKVVNAPQQISLEDKDSPRVYTPTEAFCEHFETKFFHQFCMFWSFAEGMEYKQDAMDQGVKLGAAAAEKVGKVHVPQIGDIPIGSMAAGAAVLYQAVRHHFREKRAERMVDLFTNKTLMEFAYFVHEACLALAKRYAAQINYLAPNEMGASYFADVVLERVTRYICSAKNNQIASKASVKSRLGYFFGRVLGQDLGRVETVQKDLEDIFFDAVRTVRPSDDRYETHQLRTLNRIANHATEEQWTSRGILENTGIMVINDRGEVKYFKDKNDGDGAEGRTNIAKYGFCLGTEAEALARHLEEVPVEQAIVGKFGKQRLELFRELDAKAAEFDHLRGIELQRENAINSAMYARAASGVAAATAHGLLEETRSNIEARGLSSGPGASYSASEYPSFHSHPNQQPGMASASSFSPGYKGTR